MKVKELLTDESKWTKGVYARTAEGHRADSSKPEAVVFCLLGAIHRCYSHLGKHEVVKRVEKELSGRSPCNWNDDPATTFADVRSLIEKLDI